jgi:hypothetical protein
VIIKLFTCQIWPSEGRSPRSRAAADRDVVTATARLLIGFPAKRPFRTGSADLAPKIGLGLPGRVAPRLSYAHADGGEWLELDRNADFTSQLVSVLGPSVGVNWVGFVPPPDKLIAPKMEQPHLGEWRLRLELTGLRSGIHLLLVVLKNHRRRFTQVHLGTIWELRVGSRTRRARRSAGRRTR